MLPADYQIAGVVAALRSPRQRAFCISLSRYGTITHACIEARVSYDDVFAWREKNVDFKRAWDQSMEISVDVLEIAAKQRALHGVQRPMVSGGKIVLGIDGKPIMLTDYSDRLMELILKGRRPDVFRERVTHSGDPMNPIHIRVDATDSGL
jgi:hypothetical protein